MCDLFAGAYIARQAAKSVVASGLAKRCLVQISYAIGVAQPLSVHVDTYGTGSKPDKVILAAVLKAFDFRPGKLLIRRCGCLCCKTFMLQLQLQLRLKQFVLASICVIFCVILLLTEQVYASVMHL